MVRSIGAEIFPRSNGTVTVSVVRKRRILPLLLTYWVERLEIVKESPTVRELSERAVAPSAKARVVMTSAVSIA